MTEQRKSELLNEKQQALQASQSRRADFLGHAFEALRALRTIGAEAKFPEQSSLNSDADKDQFVAHFTKGQESVLDYLPTQLPPIEEAAVGSPLTSISSNDEDEKLTTEDARARSMSVDVQAVEATPALEVPSQTTTAPVARSPSNASVEAALRPPTREIFPLRQFATYQAPTQSQSPQISPTAISPSMLNISSPAVHTLRDDGNLWHPPSLPSIFEKTLPELPTILLRNRPLAGGLWRKKKEREKERDARSNPLSGGTELFKMGLLQATHCPARNMVGQPLDSKARVVRPGKVVFTNDWNVAIQELKGLRAMEKIEQMKNEGRWSFRQIKKQKAPPVIKSHRDYMLEEMRWLHTDFRQESRWKVASAFALSSAILAYHAASPEDRKALCVKSYIPQPIEEQEAEEDEPQLMDVDEDVPDADPALSASASNTASSIVNPSSATLQPRPPSQPQLANSQPLPSPAVPIKHSPVSFEHLISLRAPLLHLPDTATTISLSQLPFGKVLPPDAPERTNLELMNGMLPDIQLYEMSPAPQHQEGTPSRSERRFDESSSHYNRMTHVSKWFDSKPFLVSTVNPAKKLRLDNTWADLADIGVGDEPREFEPRQDSTSFGPNLFNGRRPKDLAPHMQFSAPKEPPNASARNLDWSEGEDNLLLMMSKQYSHNWHLISEVFNSTTVRVPTDLRQPWDVYDRWNKRFGPGSQPNLNAEASKDAAANQSKKDKNKKAPKFEGTKKEVRHLSLYEAVRALKARRDAQPPKMAPNAPRKVNLSAHETHTQPQRPILTPIEISKIKAENDRQQLLMRQQQLAMRQQQAAMAQQYQMQQQQAAQQARLQVQQNANAVEGSQGQPSQQGSRPPSAAPSGSPAQLPGQLPQNSGPPPSPAQFANQLPMHGSPSSNQPNQQVPMLNQMAMMNQMNQFTPAQQAALQQHLRMNAGSPSGQPGMPQDNQNQAALQAALQARMQAMMQQQHQQQQQNQGPPQPNENDAAEFASSLTNL